MGDSVCPTAPLDVPAEIFLGGTPVQGAVSPVEHGVDGHDVGHVVACDALRKDEGGEAAAENGVVADPPKADAQAEG